MTKSMFSSLLGASKMEEKIKHFNDISYLHFGLIGTV